METEQIFIDSHGTHTNSQKSSKNSIISSVVTEKDILKLFENNEQYIEYFLSLREAVVECRRNGEDCWCDPRDSKMRERLELARWKPRVVVKFGDEANVDEFGFTSKQMALDEDGHTKSGTDCVDMGMRSENGDHHCSKTSVESFKCGLHGCKQICSSLVSYESHYHTCHNHVCAACKTSFVSNFLLDIHLQENHDSYFQILCPRIDMFRCLVESCDLKFRTPDLRKDHLVKAHSLPANFMFHKPMKPKGQKSKRAAVTATLTQTTGDSIKSDQNLSSSSSMSPSPSPSKMEVESHGVPLSGAVSSSMEGNAGSARGRGKKVPRTVCFGRGSRKAFQNQRFTGRTPHWHQIGKVDMDTAVDIEKVDFSDMVDSLQST